MDPITLHFNVFQAGANSEVPKRLELDNPGATTIGALKKQLFPEAVKERKSIRFIAGGRILDDATAVGGCGLGKEAHVHVSINDVSRAAVPSAADGPSSSESAVGAAADFPAAGALGSAGPSAIGVGFMLGVLFFIGTGVGLWAMWQRRWRFSMQTSQLIFILAAIWAYLLLCHGIPALLQTLSNLGKQKTGSARGTAAPSSCDQAAGASAAEASATASTPIPATFMPSDGAAVSAAASLTNRM